MTIVKYYILPVSAADRGREPFVRFGEFRRVARARAGSGQEAGGLARYFNNFGLRRGAGGGWEREKRGKKTTLLELKININTGSRPFVESICVD